MVLLVALVGSVSGLRCWWPAKDDLVFLKSMVKIMGDLIESGSSASNNYHGFKWEILTCQTCIFQCFLNVNMYLVEHKSKCNMEEVLAVIGREGQDFKIRRLLWRVWEKHPGPRLDSGNQNTGWKSLSSRDVTGRHILVPDWGDPTTHMAQVNVRNFLCRAGTGDRTREPWLCSQKCYTTVV